MAQIARIKSVPAEEYLAGEPTAETRHEYVGGAVFAMAGASAAHNLIAGNNCALPRSRLRSSACHVFMSDMKVRVSTADAFYYPDIGVTCEPVSPDALRICEPRLPVEVLSPATETTDRREKLLAYRRLSTLHQYVLVGQDARRVEVSRRGAGNDWWVDSYGGSDDVPLESVGTTPPVGAICRDVPAE